MLKMPHTSVIPLFQPVTSALLSPPSKELQVCKASCRVSHRSHERDWKAKHLGQCYQMTFLIALVINPPPLNVGGWFGLEPEPKGAA